MASLAGAGRRGKFDAFLSTQLRHHAVSSSDFESDAQVFDLIRGCYGAMKALADKNVQHDKMP